MFHILFHHFADAFMAACACYNRIASIKRIHFNCHIDFRCLKLLCMQLILNISISSHLSHLFHQSTHIVAGEATICLLYSANVMPFAVRMFEWDALLPEINEPSPRKFRIKWIFYDNKICMLRPCLRTTRVFEALYLGIYRYDWFNMLVQIRYVAFGSKRYCIHCREQGEFAGQVEYSSCNNFLCNMSAVDGRIGDRENSKGYTKKCRKDESERDQSSDTDP